METRLSGEAWHRYGFLPTCYILYMHVHICKMDEHTLKWTLSLAITVVQIVFYATGTVQETALSHAHLRPKCKMQCLFVDIKVSKILLMYQFGAGTQLHLAVCHRPSQVHRHNNYQLPGLCFRQRSHSASVLQSCYLHCNFPCR